MKPVDFPEANGKTASGAPVLRNPTHNISCIQLSAEDMEKLRSADGRVWVIVGHGGDEKVMDTLTRAQIGFHISESCPKGEPKMLPLNEAH